MFAMRIYDRFHHEKTGICSRQDAKTAKFEMGFPFASLREIFRGLFAALPR
jgi:hypothetical protein